MAAFAPVPAPASQAAAPPPAATEDAPTDRTPWRWLAAAALLIAGVALALGRSPESRWSLPAWRTNATIGAIAITLVLMLRLGAWFPVGLLAIYAALDASLRLRARRDARNRMSLPAPVDQPADEQRPAFVWRFQAGDAFERFAGYRPVSRVMFTPATGGGADASSSGEHRN